ncbi:MAG TPA: CDP-diacylglycerol--glycerol-3-phosphate 3-phosphatidyltransferase, partial [Lachnoclostridium sp.]|nr:CDP-diacylglycerol--glycerol-3-phosphate 3-phosphatidyltransferase [Lachnoclostridium sp.]
MNLPNKLTILRVIMIPFFVAALLYDGGANQNMRYV